MSHTAIRRDFWAPVSVIRETVSEVLDKMIHDPVEVEDKQKAPLISGWSIKDDPIIGDVGRKHGIRPIGENAEVVTDLFLDFDSEEAPDMEALSEEFSKYKHYAYTSYSNGWKKVKAYRFVMPLARPIPKEVATSNWYKEVILKTFSGLDEHGTLSTFRFQCLPAVCSKTDYKFITNNSVHRLDLAENYSEQFKEAKTRHDHESLMYEIQNELNSKKFTSKSPKFKESVLNRVKLKLSDLCKISRGGGEVHAGLCKVNANLFKTLDMTAEDRYHFIRTHTTSVIPDHEIRGICRGKM